MSNWTFKQEEKEEHRMGLGQYAGQRKFVDGRNLTTSQNPNVAFTNEKCSNVNLVEDKKGMFCECCNHYHAKYSPRKGFVPLYEDSALDSGYKMNNRTSINPGKYRSDWTSDDECFENPWDDEEIVEPIRKRKRKGFVPAGIRQKGLDQRRQDEIKAARIAKMKQEYEDAKDFCARLGDIQVKVK